MSKALVRIAQAKQGNGHAPHAVAWIAGEGHSGFQPVEVDAAKPDCLRIALRSEKPMHESAGDVQTDDATAFAYYVDRSKLGIVAKGRLKHRAAGARHQPVGLELRLSRRASR